MFVTLYSTSPHTSEVAWCTLLQTYCTCSSRSRLCSTVRPQSSYSHESFLSHQSKRTHGTTKLHAMDSGKVSLGQVSLLRCNIPRLLRDADGLASRRSYPKYRSSRCRLTRSYTFQKTPSLASFHREPLCLMHCRPSGRTQPSSSYSIGNFFGH